MKFRRNAGRSLCLLMLLAAGSTPVLAQDVPAPNPGPASDNTAVNVRDKQSATLKSTDQPNNKADVQLAANVRRAIINDRSLSTSAHNVKLVASSGAVTLRGPVATAEERARVGDIVANVGGVSKVDNQLEIANH